MQFPGTSFGYDIDFQFYNLSSSGISAFYSNDVANMSATRRGIQSLLESVEASQGISQPQNAWVRLMLVLDNALYERLGQLAYAFNTFG